MRACLRALPGCKGITVEASESLALCRNCKRVQSQVTRVQKPGP
jgi:hypothetical protein